MKETSIQQQLQTLTDQINKLQKHKKKVDAFMNLDVEEAIIDAVQGHVVNEVKNQLQTFVITELEAFIRQKLEGAILHWIDEDNSNEYDWFDKMVNAYKDLKDDETPQEGSMIVFANQMKVGLKTDKLTRGKDYTKPLPMYSHPHNPKIPSRYFFNKDLEYLMHGNIQDKKYALSITKYLTAIYTQGGIEENIDNRFRSSLVEYNEDVELGIHHWSKMRKGFYKWKMANKSKREVYQKPKIIAVWKDKVERDFGYGFVSKLRGIVIRKRVEDVRLGVESYHQKLNLTKPNLAFLGINKEEPYTMLQKPFGVVYISGSGSNKFMAYKEVHKFCNTTLKKLSDELSTDERLQVGLQTRLVEEL
ncbi:hypothetical protein Tco_0811701 [Tanacetum coccineum]